MKQCKLLLFSVFVFSTTIIASPKTYFNDRVLSFIGKADNQQINLSWNTAIMVTEQGFDIERLDANGVWQKIGYMKNGEQVKGYLTYSFVDASPVNGKNFYRLKHLLAEGNFAYSPTIMVELLRGTKGQLFQNYPNPFLDITLIRYEVMTRGPVRIVILDMTGTQLAQLVNKQDELPGSYQVQWNGGRYPPGTYIYKIMTADGTITQKMIKAK